MAGGTVLGWAAVGLGAILTLRGLFGHNRSFGEIMGWIAVGLGTIAFGLWQVGFFDLPRFIASQFSSS